jgi:branched-chain amino acid transport system permease protein
MNLKEIWRTNRMLIVLVVLTIVLTIWGLTGMGTQSFVRTMLSGLTLGSLFFMVAAGLTLVFGLMDVLNFAHGSMFMLGAYMGWQFYTNPTFLFGIAPLIAALITGLSAMPILQKWTMNWQIREDWRKRLPGLLSVAGVVLGYLALRGVDFLGLADTAMVSIAIGNVDPLAEISAQEPLLTFWVRPLLLLVTGLVLALASARPGDLTNVVDPATVKRNWVTLPLLAILTLALVLVRESGPVTVLLMNGDLRFVLALLVGTLSGFGFGVAVERVLVRSLYVRPFFIVLMTLGLSFVMREVVQLLWDPLAYQMSRPPAFSQPGKAENLLAWFSGRNTTIDILGVTFPSYRVFIIFLGALMFIALILLMQRTRIGMIIRAGVQDREMVEALGINVERVFLLVFALGTAMAALGGIGAAPFIPVKPEMGDAFQMQGFITVVIGGMGSYVGALIGALLLGMARAFGDYFALKLSLSPAVAEASTVIIMIIVLLVRPSGLFGKKE